MSIAVERRGDVASLATEWGELAEATRWTPFAFPEAFHAWATAFGVQELVLLAARREGRLLGVLPLYRSRGALRSALSWEAHGGVLADDPAAVLALARAAFELRPWRLFVAPLANDERLLAPLTAAAAEARYRVRTRVVERSPWLATTGSWDDYERTLSKNLTQDVRRRRRRLAELGETRVQIEDGSSRLDELLDEGFRVEAAGWKGRAGTAIAEREESRAYHIALARAAASRGWLRLAFLRVDGRAIAFALGLEASATFYYVKAGFDESYATYAPAKLLLHSLVERAFRTPDVERFDFLGSDEDYKRRYTELVDERVALDAYSPSPAGRLGRLLLGRRKS